MSGSPSTWGSSTEPPTGDLLSKFVNTLESVDIIASNESGEVDWARLGVRAGWMQRRPAYRRAEERRSRSPGDWAGNREGPSFRALTDNNGLGIVFQIWKSRSGPSSFARLFNRTAVHNEMGRLRRSRTHKAQRDTHRASRTRARTKDLDQIQLIDMDPKVKSGPGFSERELTGPRLQNRAKLEAQALDLEKPGLAQHYCVECAKCVPRFHPPNER